MHLTAKQIELLQIIKNANPDGTLVDLDQLIERTTYAPSKQSMQFSVRALIARGLIKKAGQEKRRERSRILFEIEPLGLHFMVHTRAVPFLSSEAADADLAELESLLD